MAVRGLDVSERGLLPALDAVCRAGVLRGGAGLDGRDRPPSRAAWVLWPWSDHAAARPVAISEDVLHLVVRMGPWRGRW